AIAPDKLQAAADARSDEGLIDVPQRPALPVHVRVAPGGHAVEVRLERAPGQAPQLGVAQGPRLAALPVHHQRDRGLSGSPSGERRHPEPREELEQALSWREPVTHGLTAGYRPRWARIHRARLREPTLLLRSVS